MTIPKIKDCLNSNEEVIEKSISKIASAALTRLKFTESEIYYFVYALESTAFGLKWVQQLRTINYKNAYEYYKAMANI